jgi:hypothetical protein
MGESGGVRTGSGKFNTSDVICPSVQNRTKPTGTGMRTIILIHHPNTPSLANNTIHIPEIIPAVITMIKK